MLIGGAGVMIKQDFIRVIPEFLMLGLGVPAIYLLYNHFLKDDAKRDIPLYFAKSMMYIGLVMCFQLITVITKSNVPIREWYNTAWETGWANRNLIATCLVFTAGMTAYLSTRYRQGWIFIGLSVFQYACLILTFSHTLRRNKRSIGNCLYVYKSSQKDYSRRISCYRSICYVDHIYCS